MSAFFSSMGAGAGAGVAAGAGGGVGAGACLPQAARIATVIEAKSSDFFIVCFLWGVGRSRLQAMRVPAKFFAGDPIGGPAVSQNIIARRRENFALQAEWRHWQVVRASVPATIETGRERMRARLTIEPDLAQAMHRAREHQDVRVVRDEDGLITNGIVGDRAAHFDGVRKVSLQQLEARRVRIEPSGLVDKQAHAHVARNAHERM